MKIITGIIKNKLCKRYKILSYKIKFSLLKYHIKRFLKFKYSIIDRREEINYNNIILLIFNKIKLYPNLKIVKENN